MAPLDSGSSIIALGAVTPVGGNAAMSAASVRAGICRFAEHPYMVDATGRPMVVSAARISPELRGTERYLALLLPALEEALEPAEDRVPLILGVPPPRPGRPEDLEERLVSALRGSRLGLRLSRIEVLPYGHASGLMALEAAREKLREGVSNFVLIGGVDSYLEAETLEWLESTEQLKSERHRWGFVPGEAASSCLLSSARRSNRTGRPPPLAQVLAVATREEPNRIKTDTVCVGEGLARALGSVLQEYGPETRIDQIIGDLNSERYRSAEYGFASIRVRDSLGNAARIKAPADCWGDVGAASGPLFLCMAVASARRGYAPGPLALVWASSECGKRSAALLRLSASIASTEGAA